jgi:hypothetical protein
MRRLFAITLFLLSSMTAAFAQGVRWQEVALSGLGLANAQIRVCTEPASGNPCTVLASIFSDKGLSVPLTNPFNADANGNYFFYASTANTYHIQIFLNGVLLFERPDVQLAINNTITLQHGGVLNGSQTLLNLAATGNLTITDNGSGTLTFASLSPKVIAAGQTILGTLAISSGTCAGTITATATGATGTSVVHWSMASDPNGVTGYAGSTTGAVLQIYTFPTTNAINIRVCNNSSGSITPSAMSINWDVTQ